MNRGPKISTARGRAAGGRDVSGSVSAVEHAIIKAAAAARGESLNEFVRTACLERAKIPVQARSTGDETSCAFTQRV